MSIYFILKIYQSILYSHEMSTGTQKNGKFTVEDIKIISHYCFCEFLIETPSVLTNVFRRDTNSLQSILSFRDSISFSHMVPMNYFLF